jgi:hypothetical protein
VTPTEAIASSPATVDDTIPNAWTPVAAVATVQAAATEQSVASALPTPPSEYVRPAQAEPVVEPERMATRAPVDRAEPRLARNTPEIQRVSLELPPDSGLELIETRQERSVPVSVADDTEAPRPRRVRPPRVEIPDEPLQLVETQKESTPPPAA